MNCRGLLNCAFKERGTLQVPSILSDSHYKPKLKRTSDSQARSEEKEAKCGVLIGLPLANQGTLDRLISDNLVE